MFCLRKKKIDAVFIPDALARSVKSLYEEEMTRVRVDFEFFEELEVKVGIHQGSVLSHFLFAVVVDVVSELPNSVC